MENYLKRLEAIMRECDFAAVVSSSDAEWLVYHSIKAEAMNLRDELEADLEAYSAEVWDLYQNGF